MLFLGQRPLRERTIGEESHPPGQVPLPAAFGCGVVQHQRSRVEQRRRGAEFVCPGPDESDEQKAAGARKQLHDVQGRRSGLGGPDELDKKKAAGTRTCPGGWNPPLFGLILEFDIWNNPNLQRSNTAWRRPPATSQHAPPAQQS
jgi:hypothetical protein